MGRKAREIVGLNLQELVGDLNKAYCDEWLAYFAYLHMARTVSGPGYEDISEMLEKIAKDESEHIAELAERITQLGGVLVAHPAQIEKNANNPYPEIPKTSDDYQGIMQSVIDSEAGAITVYDHIAKKTFGMDSVTYQLVTHILSEEVRHEEIFENFTRGERKILREVEEAVSGSY
jgi:bacterioferritin